MTPEHEPSISPNMKRAIVELEDLVRQQYPDAAFQVQQSPEDPTIIHLIPTVDVVDRDEVMDLVIDRMMQFQIDDSLPLFVVPVRTADREAQVRETLAREPHLAANVPVSGGD
jgi:hypothetical protein